MTGPRLPKPIRERAATARIAATLPPAAGTDVCTCADLPPGHNDDECAAATYGRAAAPRCRCSHSERQHGTDRRDRAMCFGSAMCACTTYRPEAIDRKTR